ncbi:APH(3') family aminoglycoside O-phosphotransferase [Candidatus Xianfuyuplasma coldseepsis]|uniref:Aminoglycoside 3'-phosphotransferase n=1 Tax=Candidatus Xianfuyuplasma coldseepsis TaxID=2782163 RepID=A0A7L7KQM6_9MOLU|nr:APH(3') family aminoglycoside O-phosphotransferase [Xianfuyuplasma coldseepsis]QMS84739.1 aminoglycoside 3'-phosphotransferase [Xianfuyuplasma coldseepsis]
MDLHIPISLQPFINQKTISENTTGMTGARIIESDDIIIKIEQYHHESKREIETLRFLQEKVPVPTLIDYLVENNTSYIVMSKLRGKMAFEKPYISNPDALIKHLAEAIKRLWTIDIKSCPIQNRIQDKLIYAKHLIDTNQIHREEIDYSWLKNDNIKSVEELYEWLLVNQPEEDLVFTHGDFCLPNVLFTENQLVGYIDLGRAGVADRYQDIALCARSLSYNLSVKLNDQIIMKFLQEFKIPIKWDKIMYYIILDELF